jgi:hypothetical protein
MLLRFLSKAVGPREPTHPISFWVDFPLRSLVPAYAAEHFRDAEDDTLTTFQAVPLKDPLLKDFPRKLSRAALEGFKIILQYSGVDTTGEPGDIAALSRLVTLVEGFDILRDEVYMQLVKQTRDTPSIDGFFHTWEILLLIATIYPASPALRDVLKSHISEAARSSDQRVAAIAQFTYLKFISRCKREAPLAGAASSGRPSWSTGGASATDSR